MNTWVLVPHFYYVCTGRKDFSHLDIGFLPVGGPMEHLELPLSNQKKGNHQSQHACHRFLTTLRGSKLSSKMHSINNFR